MRKFRHPVLSERTLAGLYRISADGPLAVDHIVERVVDPCCSKDEALREYLPSIFFCYRYPSPGDMVAMDRMYESIHTGSLHLIIEPIAVEPDIPSQPVEPEYHRVRISESKEHKAMKQWARRHLESRGIPPVDGEISVLGYHADVGSRDHTTFIECGDTEPSKVFEFVRKGLSIGILQYDAEDIVWFEASKELVGNWKGISEM